MRDSNFGTPVVILSLSPRFFRRDLEETGDLRLIVACPSNYLTLFIKREKEKIKKKKSTLFLIKEHI